MIDSLSDISWTCIDAAPSAHRRSRLRLEGGGSAGGAGWRERESHRFCDQAEVVVAASFLKGMLVAVQHFAPVLARRVLNDRVVCVVVWHAFGINTQSMFSTVLTTHPSKAFYKPIALSPDPVFWTPSILGKAVLSFSPSRCLSSSH